MKYESVSVITELYVPSRTPGSSKYGLKKRNLNGFSQFLI